MSTPLPSFTAKGKVYKAARTFHKRLLASDDAALRQMIRHYEQQYKMLKPKLVKMIDLIEEAKASGEVVNPSWLFQARRYQALMDETQQRLEKYLTQASDIITQQQAAGIRAGLDNADVLLKFSIGELPPGFNLSFAKLSTEPYERMLGYMQNGQPVDGLFKGIPGDVKQQMQDRMLEGLETGINPRVVARGIDKAFAGVLNNTLCVCRTEFMRSYRQAAHDTYAANADIMDGWVWSIDPSTRTCAACWAMDGSVHPVTESLNDHPNGRCYPVPLTKTWQDLFPGIDMSNVPETRIEPVPGAERFAALDESEQRKILGPKRFAAYQNGDIELADVAGVHHSTIWGDAIQIRPIRETPGMNLPNFASGR